MSSLAAAIDEVKTTLHSHVRAMNPVSVPAALNEIRRQCVKWGAFDSFEKDKIFNSALTSLVREGFIIVHFDTDNGEVVFDLSE